MNRETFARLVPMSTRNLANVEAGRKPSPTVLRQLTQLKRVVNALSEVIQKDAIGPWLEQPNEAFDGLKPIEVIERGEVDRIWQMIATLSHWLEWIQERVTPYLGFLLAVEEMPGNACGISREAAA